MCDRQKQRENELAQRIRAMFDPTLDGSQATLSAASSNPELARHGGNRWRKLWELEEKLHCPVVGSCFDLRELARLAQVFGFLKGELDDYRLHVEAVALSSSRNPVAQAMHKLLERKFARFIAAFEQAQNDADVLRLWCEHLARGEVAGGMWAALTHKAASVETRNRIYADVHMLSHQVGAGQAADLRRLEWLKRTHAESAAENARLARRVREQQARMQTLERERDAARLEAAAVEPLRARLQALESGQAIVALGQRLMLAQAEAERSQEFKAQALVLQEQVSSLARELEQTRQELAKTLAERDALERLWIQERTPISCEGQCTDCAEKEANGRCVLCVGGRQPLLPHYRQLAARLGMRLIHHDGGKEEGLARLSELLAACDAVICPTDCVGHRAYYQLKKHCKLAGKPCLLTRSSGVASIAAALEKLSKQEVLSEEEVCSQVRPPQVVRMQLPQGETA